MRLMGLLPPHKGLLTEVIISFVLWMEKLRPRKRSLGQAHAVRDHRSLGYTAPCFQSFLPFLPESQFLGNPLG